MVMSSLKPLVSAEYLYVRLIPRDLSALRLDSHPFGRVPGFGGLAYVHSQTASDNRVVGEPV